MNCDQVFEILTGNGSGHSGPDDRRAVDRRRLVTGHLDTCAACRSLSAAMAPALDLFDEAALWDGSCCEDTTPAAADVMPAASVGAARGWRPERFLAVAAALIVGLGTTLGLRAGLSERSAMPAAESFTSPANVATLVAAINSLGLADACLDGAQIRADVQSTTAAARSANKGASPHGGEARRPMLAPRGGAGQVQAAGLECCTLCHAAGRELALARPATARVAQSCLLCHASPPPAWQF